MSCVYIDIMSKGNNITIILPRIDLLYGIKAEFSSPFSLLVLANFRRFTKAFLSNLSPFITTGLDQLVSWPERAVNPLRLSLSKPPILWTWTTTIHSQSSVINWMTKISFSGHNPLWCSYMEKGRMITSSE